MPSKPKTYQEYKQEKENMFAWQEEVFGRTIEKFKTSIKEKYLYEDDTTHYKPTNIRPPKKKRKKTNKQKRRKK
jgi:hypothetical protein